MQKLMQDQKRFCQQQHGSNKVLEEFCKRGLMIRKNRKVVVCGNCEQDSGTGYGCVLCMLS